MYSTKLKTTSSHVRALRQPYLYLGKKKSAASHHHIPLVLHFPHRMKIFLQLQRGTLLRQDGNEKIPRR
jgi:hypothetical protein